MNSRPFLRTVADVGLLRIRTPQLGNPSRSGITPGHASSLRTTRVASSRSRRLFATESSQRRRQQRSAQTECRHTLQDSGEWMTLSGQPAPLARTTSTQFVRLLDPMFGSEAMSTTWKSPGTSNNDESRLGSFTMSLKTWVRSPFSGSFDTVFTAIPSSSERHTSDVCVKGPRFPTAPGGTTTENCAPRVATPNIICVPKSWYALLFATSPIDGDIESFEDRFGRTNRFATLAFASITTIVRSVGLLIVTICPRSSRVRPVESR